MWYVLVGILCLAVGGTAVWQLMVKKIQAELDLCQINKREILKSFQDEQALVTDFVSTAEAIYYASFGPIGTHPSTLTEAFNELWKLIGKPEKGVPN